MHFDVTSMIFAYYSKKNFSKKKQNNELLWKKLPTHFTLLYTETIKRGGEISLHKTFYTINMTCPFSPLDRSNHQDVLMPLFPFLIFYVLMTTLVTTNLLSEKYQFCFGQLFSEILTRHVENFRGGGRLLISIQFWSSQMGKNSRLFKTQNFFTAVSSYSNNVTKWRTSN